MVFAGMLQLMAEKDPKTHHDFPLRETSCIALILTIACEGLSLYFAFNIDGIQVRFFIFLFEVL